MELDLASELLQVGKDLGQRYAITMSKFRRRRLSMINWNSNQVKTKKCMTPKVLKRESSTQDRTICAIENDTEMICSILETATRTHGSQLDDSSALFTTEVDVKNPNPKNWTGVRRKRKSSYSLFQEWNNICNDIGLWPKNSSQTSMRRNVSSLGPEAGRVELDVSESVASRPGARVSVLQKFEGTTQLAAESQPTSEPTPKDDIFANEGIRLKSSRAWTDYSARLKRSTEYPQISESTRTSRLRYPLRIKLSGKRGSQKLSDNEKPLRQTHRRQTSQVSVPSSETTLEDLSLTLIEKYSDTTGLPNLSKSFKAPNRRQKKLTSTFVARS